VTYIRMYIVKEREQSGDSELWVQCDHMSIYKIELEESRI